MEPTAHRWPQHASTHDPTAPLQSPCTCLIPQPPWWPAGSARAAAECRSVAPPAPLSAPRRGCCRHRADAATRSLSAPAAAGSAATSLDAARNALESVPPAALATLCALTSIDLSRNRLAAWPLPLRPPADGGLPALRSLDLSGNRQLPPLPATALECCAGTLTRLDLSGAAHAVYTCQTPATHFLVVGPVNDPRKHDICWLWEVCHLRIRASPAHCRMPCLPLSTTSLHRSPSSCVPSCGCNCHCNSHVNTWKVRLHGVGPTAGSVRGDAE